MTRAKITASVLRRDWRWLWLRKKQIDTVVFRGNIEKWDAYLPNIDTTDAVKDA